MFEKPYIIFLSVILLFCIHVNVQAQQEHVAGDRQVIQFSGVVVDGSDLKQLPFTSIMISNTHRGTISDYYGYFSFVAQERDTIIFSSVGYKKAYYVIPDSLTTDKYSLIQVMTRDTIMLAESVIYPWPTVEQFKRAFISLDIPDDDLERAKKNLAFAEMKERLKQSGMDASINYKNYIEQQTSKLYYAGQYPPNNLLNPLAWAKFIKAWRDGKFKRQD